MFSNRPSLPADFCTFDIAFEPLFPLGKRGERFSAEYLIQQRLCKDALAGKRKAVSVVLRYAAAQEAERAKQQVRGPALPSTKQDRERRATTAMLILSIASSASTDGPICLEPWVTDLALSRDDDRTYSEADAIRIRRQTRPVDAPAPSAYRLPPTAAAELRSPKATRFQKGQSGNPKGRPKKTKHDVPFTNYLDEIGTVTVHGKEVRMTRLQFVLHVLNTKAIQGDACMTSVLAGKYLSERMQRYRRNEHIRYPAPLHDQHNLPERIASDPFEQMLRHFRITNPRTKTRVLLEPWVVEAALERFGERRLTTEEQAEVLRSASKPNGVAWPDWWEIRSHADAKPYRPVKPRFRRKAAEYCNETRY